MEAARSVASSKRLWCQAQVVRHCISHAEFNPRGSVHPASVGGWKIPADNNLIQMCLAACAPPPPDYTALLLWLLTSFQKLQIGDQDLEAAFVSNLIPNY